MSSIRIHDDTRGGCIYNIIICEFNAVRMIFKCGTEGELLWLKNGVFIFIFSSSSSSLLYYYYCFRRIFSLPILHYNMHGGLFDGRIIIIIIIYCTDCVRVVVVIINVCVYYIIIVVPTVLPIPRNLLLLFFNTNRDFSFKVVKNNSKNMPVAPSVMRTINQTSFMVDSLQAFNLILMTS